MSKGGYLVPAMRWGARLGHTEMTDMMLGALQDPFGLGHMGITAENVATDYDISRQDMDEFALASQQRAANAIEQGYFSEQIVPVEVKERRQAVMFAEDEHPRGQTTLDSLSALRPAFAKDGAVTAGNSSGINDGAAALVLASGLWQHPAIKNHWQKSLPMALAGCQHVLWAWGRFQPRKWHWNAPG